MPTRPRPTTTTSTVASRLTTPGGRSSPSPAGLLVALSLPPWGWWPLAFVGIAVFELAARRDARRAGDASCSGSSFGFAWLAIGMAWMWQLTAPGYIAASVDLRAATTPSPSWPSPDRDDGGVIGRPAAHTLVEALRFSFPFGGVPLASLGIAQAAGPFAGVARVGGVILLTWVVFQVGFALGALVDRAPRRRPRERPAPGAGRCSAPLAVIVLACVAPRGHGHRRTFLDIAAVQGGGEQGTERARRAERGRHRTPPRGDAHDRARRRPRPRRVAGERRRRRTTSPAATSSPRSPPRRRRLGVPIAVGVTEDVAGRPDRFTNAQVVVTPDGEVTSRYDKVRRVPFGEYVPLRGLLEALGAPVDQVPHDAVAGTGPAVLDAARRHRDSAW